MKKVIVSRKDFKGYRVSEALYQAYTQAVVYSRDNHDSPDAEEVVNLLHEYIRKNCIHFDIETFMDK